MSAGAGVPSWQGLLKAIAVAAVLASALDLGIQYWRTPLGWSSTMMIGVFGIGAIIGLIFAAAMGLIIGLPLGRLLARFGAFRPAILLPIGGVLGFLAAVLFSALGNTYIFMSGPGFWKSAVIDAVFGITASGLWWGFEKRRRSADLPKVYD